MNTLKYCHLRAAESSRAVRVPVSLLLIIVCMAFPVLTSAAQGERLVVLPFEIVDNTPVPGGEARNEKMLDTITRFTARNIGETGLFDVVSQAEVDDAVSAARLGTYIHTCNRCEYDLARQIDGDKVMVGWIYKMSILVLTLHIEVKDVASEKTLISKAYDFRGDNEKAWLRAAGYMVRDVAEMLGK